jgi:NADH:ubiquinone oxidoreductase subunit 5 (subunit L)/multisubunit Na+/H+ antiporter MnhA subunit
VLAGVFFVHFVLSAIVRLKILSEEKTEKLRVFVELYFKWGVHIDFVQLTFFLIVTFALIQIATLELYA